MRILWLILGLAIAAPANAESRLKLITDRPMVIVVNMIPYTVGTDHPVNVEFKDGKEGTQRITVRNMLGQVVHQGTVVVPRDFVVTVAWRDRQLEVVDRKLLKHSTGYNAGRGKRKQAGHSELDALAKSPEEPQADLLSLAASDEGQPTGEGGSGLGPVANELTIQETAEPAPSPTPQSAGKGTTQVVESKVLPGGDGADSATIRLHPQSQSWANVWIGDQKVWEYRGKGDVLEVKLAPGAHPLVVKDFRDQNGWGAGVLTLGANESSSVHFSMSQPIEAQGGTWAPQE